MIKVLHVFGTTNRGGAETMIMNYFRAIDRSEISFDFVNHTADKCQYDDEIVKLGGRIFHMKRYNVYNTISYLRQWIVFLNSHKEFHIIHIHNFKVGFAVSLAAKIVGVKTIIMHSHSAAIGQYTLRNIFFLAIKPAISLFSSHNFACGVNAGRYLYGKKSFIVMNNAINVESFKFNPDTREIIREELGLKNDELAFVNVGRFFPPKNHFFLLDVFKRYTEISTNCKLFLVGSGELENQIRDKIVKLGIENNVVLLGVKENVNELLCAMDCFLFPSLWEGLPVTLVEAQSNGLKVLASDTITTEVNITPLVHFLPLAVDKWVEAMKNTDNNDNRLQYFYLVECSLYNINTSAKWLERFYEQNY